MTTIPRTALDHDGFRGGIDVRVSLRANAGDGSSAFDGAWFPRTRDLAVELPELIAELDRRGVRVERFTYALDAWDAPPRILNLEQALEFCAEDECVEVTPATVRIRKVVLDQTERGKAKNRKPKPV